MNDGILLVEDNPSDEKLTVRAFAKGSVATDIFVVRDGAEALEYLFRTGRHARRAPSALPRLILLDLSLPLVDGFEVLERVRRDERTSLLPVVVLTASKEHEDVVRAYSLGANAYVCKPVDFTQFAETVKTLALFWLVLNEYAPTRFQAGAGAP